MELYFGASGCEVQTKASGKVCCAPGPAQEVSSTLQNVLIIGDSVSDQYTPSVAALLKETALVQHAPWVGGGSANDVANGLFNLQNCRWLRPALRPDEVIPWDLVTFNFGLHDLFVVVAPPCSMTFPHRRQPPLTSSRCSLRPPSAGKTRGRGSWQCTRRCSGT